MTKDEYMATIQQSLRGRFQRNSLGVFVIVGIVVVLMLLLQVVKFAKKIYTHDIPHYENKYLVSKIMSHQQKIPSMEAQMNINPHSQIDKTRIGRQSTVVVPVAGHKVGELMQNREQSVQQLGKRMKPIKSAHFLQPQKQGLINFIHRANELITRKLPLMAVVLVNVALIASFEYLLATLAIGIVLFVVVEILKKTQHQNVAWIIELLTHVVVAGWFVNIFAVGMPV